MTGFGVSRIDVSVVVAGLLLELIVLLMGLRIVRVVTIPLEVSGSWWLTPTSKTPKSVNYPAPTTTTFPATAPSANKTDATATVVPALPPTAKFTNRSIVDRALQIFNRLLTL